MKIELEPVKTVRVLGLSNTIAWLAAFWSYSINHSILWAIFHFAVAPVYLAYRVAKFLPR